MADTFLHPGLRAGAGGAGRRRSRGRRGADRLLVLRHGDGDHGGHLGRGAGSRGRGADRGGRRSWTASRPPTGSAARPATTPARGCSAATATSTTPRSPSSGWCAAAPAGSASWTWTSTTATARSRSSGSAATCRTPRSTAIPTASTRTSRGMPTRPAAARAAGATFNKPLPAGTADDALPAELERALDWLDGRDDGMLVVSLGIDTYEPRPAVRLRPHHGRLPTLRRAGGRDRRPAAVLQEGGYYLPELGENVRQWLRGAAGLPPRRLGCAHVRHRPRHRPHRDPRDRARLARAQDPAQVGRDAGAGRQGDPQGGQRPPGRPAKRDESHRPPPDRIGSTAGTRRPPAAGVGNWFAREPFAPNR